MTPLYKPKTLNPNVKRKIKDALRNFQLTSQNKKLFQKILYEKNSIKHFLFIKQ